MQSTRRTFIRQIGFATAGLGILSECQPCWAASGSTLPHSTPEAQGISSKAILEFLDVAAKKHIELHGFVLVRHGHVIAEGWWQPYAKNLNHSLYSMSKSFTSTAVGLAASEGRLTVNDPVISFFPEFLPQTISDNLKALKIKDMLSMSVGHAQDSTGSIVHEDNWVKAFLALPIPNKPGTTFVYNSGATYMCSAIVQKVTGEKIIDYLTPRLFKPLGIRGMTWETCPRGINTGGWGLSVPTEALAKFGQLYLQKGLWQGKQIIPTRWVEEATSFKIQQPLPAENPEKARENSDWLQGYCYQFWRARHNAYRGDGAFGQYTIVMPDQDAVFAAHCETNDMQAEQNLLWDILLPAMKNTPLPEDPVNQKELKAALASLKIAPLLGAIKSTAAANLSGKTFKFDDNKMGFQEIRFDFTSKSVGTFTLTTTTRGTQIVRFGLANWVLGTTGLIPPTLVATEKIKSPDKSRIAACGFWKDDQTLEMRWQFYDTPHHDSVLCRFENGKLTLSLKTSLGEQWPDLTAHSA